MSMQAGQGPSGGNWGGEGPTEHVAGGGTPPPHQNPPSGRQRPAPPPGPGSRWSVRVGRIAGVPVRIHASMLLWVWLLGAAGGLSSRDAILANVGWLVAIFACVLIHELAHSLVAKRTGANVGDIVLFPLGGVSQIGLSERPGQEAAVTAAGPGMSIVLAAVLGLAAVLHGDSLLPITLSTGSLLVRLTWFNLLVAGFNLLPAFPLDGGRLLRAILASRVGYPRATAVAATVGRVAGIAMIGVGVIYNFWLAFIGVLVLLGATAERRVAAQGGGRGPRTPRWGGGAYGAGAAVDAQSRPAHRPGTLGAMVVEDVMLPNPWTVDESETVTAVTAEEACRRQGVLPVLSGGRYRGLIASADAWRLGYGAPAGTATTPAPAIAPWANGEAAARAVADSPDRAAVVVTAEGVVVGVLRHSDLLGGLAGTPRGGFA